MIPNNMVIGWECDFCGKCGLTISSAGIIYCPYCHKSYGKSLGSEKIEKVLNTLDSIDREDGSKINPSTC